MKESPGSMRKSFKRVPALDKCFQILEFSAQSKIPLSITNISNKLGFHKSTISSIIYTLEDLGVLENDGDKKFRLGTKLYELAKAASENFGLIHTIHPYLEEINKKTKLSVFLGIRLGLDVVVVDKVESTFDVKISADIGTRYPLLGGAAGKALLSQLSDAEIDEILSKNKLKRFTRYTCVHKKKCKEMITMVRQEGVAISNEEYVEGVRALAVPLKIRRWNFPITIWMIGLKSQINDKNFISYSNLLKEAAKKIEVLFSVG